MLITEEQEYAIGKNAVPQMEMEFGGAVPDNEINNYVSGIGNKMSVISKKIHR
ncbi:MAG: peptidase M48, partial [Planctomycetes bacterium]|nr:peptidase M48 [Planctomycetota bacterium]